MSCLSPKTNRRWRGSLPRGLREQTYAVDVARTALEALSQAQVDDYDLFILDKSSQ